jgi:thiosulfate reductase cytochrome b subunit
MVAPMTTLDVAVAPTAAPPAIERVIVIKHHWLVRLSHWMNVVLLTGLVMSGLSIYWASPVFQHAPDPHTGSRDYVADLGLRIGHSKTWVYDKLGLGVFALADALQLHWLFAYLFMLTGLLYLAGLAAGGGWRSLMPRRGQLREAIRMQWYYFGVVPMKILRRPWTHAPVTTKYNGLQRTAYASMPVAGVLIVASGWAMHKPAQFHWLERMFGSYDGARIVHFLMMALFLAFVIPHVVLAAADGWDTMRSMVVGWSGRVAPQVAYAAPAAVAAPIPPVVPPVIPSVARDLGGGAAPPAPIPPVAPPVIPSVARDLGGGVAPPARIPPVAIEEAAAPETPADADVAAIPTHREEPGGADDALGATRPHRSLATLGMTAEETDVVADED